MAKGIKKITITVDKQETIDVIRAARKWYLFQLHADPELKKHIERLEYVVHNNAQDVSLKARKAAGCA